MTSRKSGIGSHTLPNHGQTVTWLTPRHIVEALGPFDLDPCCPRYMPWRTAATMYARETQGPSNPDAEPTVTACGLSMPWAGFVWCNPPYDKTTGWWLGKMATHGDGVALIFARTETQMFFDSVWSKASSLLFLKGRLTFCLPDGTSPKITAGGPSVLIGYGKRATDRLHTASWGKDAAIKGQFIYLRDGQRGAR